MMLTSFCLQPDRAGMPKTSHNSETAMSLFTRLLIASAVACLSSPALARVPLPVPEPDVLSLLGAGVVAGIIAWRIRRRK